MSQVRHDACDAYYCDDDDDDVALITETGMAEKFEDRRRLWKSAFCSSYREIELATRENITMYKISECQYRVEIVVGKLYIYQCRSQIRALLMVKSRRSAD